MTNDKLIEQFIKDRNTAFINAVMKDDWKGLKKYCKKYRMPIPSDEQIMKAGVCKAIQEITSIPDEVKEVAFWKCLEMGFSPSMR